MKKLPLAAVACIVLGWVLVHGSTPQSGVSATPSAPSAPGSHPPAPVRYPALHDAVAALERAKATLNSAPNDFGGHRSDALAACDNATVQLNLALQYANATP